MISYRHVGQVSIFLHINHELWEAGTWSQGSLGLCMGECAFVAESVGGYVGESVYARTGRK